jgi:hypothetical protein
MAKFDPTSGDAIDLFRGRLWEAARIRLEMEPPLIVCCITRNGDVFSITLETHDDPTSYRKIRSTRNEPFELPLTVVIVDRNHSVATGVMDADGTLGTIVAPIIK